MAKHLRHKLGFQSVSRSIGTQGKVQKNKINIEKLEEEKNRVKNVYGISEKEIHRYVKETVERSESPSTELLRRLETRLDNIVYRLGFVSNRNEAKVLIKSGHITVNGVIRDDPSFHVQNGESIHCVKTSQQERFSQRGALSLPSWLSRKHMEGKIVHTPTLHEMKRKNLKVDKVITYYAAV